MSNIYEPSRDEYEPNHEPQALRLRIKITSIKESNPFDLDLGSPRNTGCYICIYYTHTVHTPQHTASHLPSRSGLNTINMYIYILYTHRAHPATHCNTVLQHTAATHCNTHPQYSDHEQFDAQQVTATHCNTLQQHTATTHCKSLQHTATHCNNTLQQHTASHCNTR